MKKKKTETVRYSPDKSLGLSTEQVNKRISDGLTNTVKKSYSKSYFSIFAENIFTFFNLLGLIVAITLAIFKMEISRFVFVSVYSANILIGIIQEIRAKKCIDRLSLVSEKKIQVIRNGIKASISSNDLVLDDIYLLGLGSQIPTDSIIIDGEIEVNESLLTGESVAIKKTVGDSLLSGSFITSGTCTVQAVKVGKNNYVQTLSAKAKKYKKPHSEIMSSLKLIIKVIGFTILPIAAGFVAKAYINDHTVFNDFDKLKSLVDSTSAVIIGMIPSGMFLLTSLALAIGIIKLAQQNTLVQDLFSLEMLARVDTVCFDKTGTITDGRMTVKEVVPLCDSKHPIDSIVSSMLGTLNDNNQTANALCNKFGQKLEYPAKHSLHFNSIRKLSAVSFEEMGTYAFGAPEFVLNKKNYAEIEPLIKQYASMGLRILLLAHSNHDINGDVPPSDFTPVALLILVDNIREDAIETIKWFKDNDVAIKVISGDNPITVSEVSKRVGIENADKYVSLEGLTDSEVFDCANKYTVFGRVSPEQKAILVKALKASGHTTAMTGDGVNDILALKEADCAISVASGSPAARNIANIVLLDNNFSSMPKVVFEGRRVINNVQSSASLFLMKTMFIMLLSIITLCVNNSTYPFNLSQMQMLELLILGIAPFFLSLQPNKQRVSGKFISYVFRKAMPSAVLMIISVLLVRLSSSFLLNLYPNITIETYTTLAVFAMTYCGLVNLFMICKPFNAYRTILFISIFSVLAIITVYTVFNGSKFLSLVGLSPLKDYWQHILIVVAIVLLDISLSSNIQKIFDLIWAPKKKKQK